MDISAIIEATERIKFGLLAKATDGDYKDSDFKADLQIAASDNHVSKLLPSFIKAGRSTADFRRSMQGKFERYAERRQYIEGEFEPVFEYLEQIRKGRDKFSNDLDAYAIGERLGYGGFATVFRYHHKLLNYDFAIKVFEPVFVSNDENIEGEKRFFREAKVLFQLCHENIVRVYDIGRIDGKPFIRMELVDGDTLQEYVSKHGTVSFERSIKPIAAILHGLSFAHDKGIIHRDLKPSNVMVKPSGEFKIIDFGISAYIENENHSKLTKTGDGIAGGAYIDPLLMMNPKMRDVRSDIYSVGAIWCFLLTGRPPAGGNMQKTLLASNNLTEFQSTIVLKCIAGDLEDRYRSCEEIMNLLSPSTLPSHSNSPGYLNRLTEITREAIYDYLTDRYFEDSNAYIHSQSASFRQPERVFCYFGRRTDVVFLSRLYDLKKIPTIDSKYVTFEEEIRERSEKDLQYGWVFYDDRLGLTSQDDEVLLRFLCEMFHPMIRAEKSDWQRALGEINMLLEMDGYEIYESEKISGRSVYSYRFK